MIRADIDLSCSEEYSGIRLVKHFDTNEVVSGDVALDVEVRQHRRIRRKQSVHQVGERNRYLACEDKHRVALLRHEAQPGCQASSIDTVTLRMSGTGHFP